MRRPGAEAAGPRHLGPDTWARSGWLHDHHDTGALTPDRGPGVCRYVQDARGRGPDACRPGPDTSRRGPDVSEAGRG